MEWLLLAFLYLSIAVLIFSGIMQHARTRDFWTGLLAAGIAITWPMWLTLIALGCS